jgi:hypothetical protein
MLSFFALGILMGFSSLAQAQDNERRRGGDFDPAQFRQRMMDRLKEQLGSSDDEWKVLQPKVEKVMNAQRDARSGGGGGVGFFFGGGGGGGRGRDGGGGGGDQPQTPVAKASADLRSGLENKDLPAEEIARRLTALREARNKARDELTKSQKELKELLTQRQEAMLVMAGMLE